MHFAFLPCNNWAYISNRLELLQVKHLRKIYLYSQDVQETLCRFRRMAGCFLTFIYEDLALVVAIPRCRMSPRLADTEHECSLLFLNLFWKVPLLMNQNDWIKYLLLFLAYLDGLRLRNLRLDWKMMILRYLRIYRWALLKNRHLGFKLYFQMARLLDFLEKIKNLLLFLSLVKFVLVRKGALFLLNLIDTITKLLLEPVLIGWKIIFFYPLKVIEYPSYTKYILGWIADR